MTAHPGNVLTSCIVYLFFSFFFFFLLLLSFRSRQRVISSCLVFRAVLFFKGVLLLGRVKRQNKHTRSMPMYIMKWIEMNQLFNKKIKFTGYSHNKS